MPAPYARFAKYYDLVYKGLLDYEGQCDLLEGLFDRYLARRPSSLLDLACGTGVHAVALGRRGYSVTGLDVSRAQLREARAKLKGRDLPVRFVQADMRRFDLGRTFDAAICMFGGFGYLLTDRDIRSHFACVRRHLAPGGIYAFEFWREGGVRPRHQSWYRRERPFRLIRLDQAAYDSRRRRLAISFEFFVFDRERLRDHFREAHTIRVHSIPAIRRLLAAEGLSLVAAKAMEPETTLTPIRERTFRVLALSRLRET